ncbi:MSHA biogenesis protein MshJ [Herminiimonas arsenitoxidans]|uniref:MSHA biogenesis protein MshJ n=1 Tax=Herminiimonas arsenitoxidans TaxID=1809410 RepID=UPI0009707A2D|nr:MSHA biogenesis protein MshJ [Herminiimonas arsenitoxidans]
MKQSWQKLALRIDALTLRERAIIFAIAVLIFVLLINAALLDPQYAKQSKLSQQIKEQQAQIADIQNQIQQRVKAQENDPNRDIRERMQELQQRAQQMNDALGDMQKGLVSPNRMADLLESVLKKNDKLLLLSLKTLPVKKLNEVAEAEEKKATEIASILPVDEESDAVKTVYKHTVELKVQGNYMDMLNYMKSLESMPWQIFWGSAELVVDEYPSATLTLTLFTLSLDKKWLNL